MTQRTRGSGGRAVEKFVVVVVRLEFSIRLSEDDIRELGFIRRGCSRALSSRAMALSVLVVCLALVSFCEILAGL